MKSNYDAAIKERQFEVGSFVLVYTPPKQQSHVYGKWKVAWQGPFKVMKRLNSTNHVVKRSHKAKDFVVHRDRLREYRGNVDSTAWLAAKVGGQQSATAGLDSSTSDPDAADQATDHARSTQLAQSTLANSDSALPGGRRRHKQGGRRPGEQATSSSGGSPAAAVSIPTDINYANRRPVLGDGPIADDDRRTRPSRDRRRPAWFLTRIDASDAAVEGGTECRDVENCVKLNNNSQSCEELLRASNCSRTSSVDSNCRSMPDKRQKKGKRRHRSDSSDSDNCHGRRPRQQQPPVPFAPHYCGQCALPQRKTKFAT